MRKYPIGLTSLVGTLGGIIIGFVAYGIAGAILVGLFGFAVGSLIDIEEYYTKGRWRNRSKEEEPMTDSCVDRIVDGLKQLDKDFEELDGIYSSEGICPTPELYRYDHCVCKYDLACNLGDPKPRKAAHEHVKKALDRIMAWM